MKKLLILFIFGVLLVSCAKNKAVTYNTARIDNIETYLKTHKYIKPSENSAKLTEEGKLEYSEEYKSILEGGIE